MRTESGYAPVGGVDVYWESRSSGGTPLVVVHGGYGVTSMFGDVLDLLAERRQVVAIELQGHGHTRDVAGPFSWEGFGDQVAGVVAHLSSGQADVLGLSLGGGAALRCAIQHPDLVRKLVVVAAPCRRDGWFPEVRAGFDGMSRALFGQLRQSPLYEAWAKVAPDPDSFPVLIDKTGDLLRRPYDWSEEVKGLPMPVLLVYADADSIPPSHAAEFFALLGGGQRDAGWDASGRPASRLAILPGMTHYDIATSPRLASVADDFLATTPLRVSGTPAKIMMSVASIGCRGRAWRTPQPSPRPPHVPPEVQVSAVTSHIPADTMSTDPANVGADNVRGRNVSVATRVAFGAAGHARVLVGHTSRCVH